jgi:hypothetical protein
VSGPGAFARCRGIYVLISSLCISRPDRKRTLTVKVAIQRQGASVTRLLLRSWVGHFRGANPQPVYINFRISDRRRARAVSHAATYGVRRVRRS